MVEQWVDMIRTMLPSLAPDMVLLLNLVAFAAIGLFLGLPFVSFKGGAARVGAEFATNTKLVIAIVLGLGVIAVANTLIKSIYDLAVFQGYQAIGVILLAVSLKVLHETNRKPDTVLGGLIISGGFLFVFPYL